MLFHALHSKTGVAPGWQFVDHVTQTNVSVVNCYNIVRPKNIDRGRNSSCYIALCAKPVGNFTTVTDRQLFGFGNLWFYTFIKDICLEKCYSIYPVKIIQQSIQKMWKNNNIILQLNQWKLCVGYPQTVHDPSCCWQHKSCYSNILLICWSWVRLE